MNSYMTTHENAFRVKCFRLHVNRSQPIAQHRFTFGPKISFIPVPSFPGLQVVSVAWPWPVFSFLHGFHYELPKPETE